MRIASKVVACCMVASAFAAFAKESGTVINSDWAQARVLKGVYGDSCAEGYAEGLVTVKCGKANKKGMAKVSMTVSLASGKKISYPAVSVDVSWGVGATVRWPEKDYVLTIERGGAFHGSPDFEGGQPVCSPRSVWSADIGGELFGEHVFSFPLWYLDEETGSEIDFLKKVGLFAKYKGGLCVSSAVDMTAIRFTFNRDMMVFPKETSDVISSQIRYNPQTGVFRGKALLMTGPYCMVWGSSKSPFKQHTLKINGFYANGWMFGTATCKKFVTEVRGR